MNKTAREYKELKRAFRLMPMEYRPVPFFHMNGCFAENGALRPDVAKNMALYKKSGYGGIAPIPVSERGGHKGTTPAFGTDAYYDSYRALLDKAGELGMQVIYYDDRDFSSGCAGGEFSKTFPKSTAKMLKRYNMECMEGQKISRQLHTEDDAVLMSLVAVEVDTRCTTDLRPFITEGKIVWEVPHGNWNIEEYVCVNAGNGFANFLNYDASMEYISMTYKRFFDRYAEYIGNVINMTFYDDMQYQAPNRRMWDERFNEVFAEKYGFDPAPYYPALWEDAGEDTAHYKALMMDCRAHMFADGFFKAVGDFAREHGLVCAGHVAEAKAAFGAWLYGDHFLCRKYNGAVGLDMVHAYMYGFNGLKLASSAAYNYDIETVTCEIYGNYQTLDKRILYCEAMNAFARGANYMIPRTLWLSGHARIPHEVSHRNYKYKAEVPNLLDYMTRCQTLLRGGRHVCDIAVLYPIYSVHTQSFLYETERKGWEYSTASAKTDYTTLINSITAFSGRDVTVIHPEVMRERMSAENGVLYLNNAVNFEQFRVLFMPAMSMISLDNLRMIKKFWEGGGIVIATVELPTKAVEFTPDTNSDAEVVAIIAEIFGTKGTTTESMNSRIEHHNENGGIAYFLPSEKTAADGAYLASSLVVDEVLDNLPVAYDVEMLNIPRLDDQGMLSLALPAYIGYGVADAMVKGGVFGCIHKRQEDCDVYFFANSTAADYDGRVLLRGEHKNPELWDPHTGKIGKAAYELVNWRGETYTKLELKLKSAESTFVISGPESEQRI